MLHGPGPNPISLYCHSISAVAKGVSRVSSTPFYPPILSVHTTLFVTRPPCSRPRNGRPSSTLPVQGPLGDSGSLGVLLTNHDFSLSFH